MLRHLREPRRVDVDRDDVSADGGDDLHTETADAACADELIRVLAYPRFKLSESDIAELLGDYLPWTKVLESVSSLEDELPACRDPADQMFLTLAAAAGADVLVTEDSALLELDGRLDFEILSPAELQRRLR